MKVEYEIDYRNIDPALGGWLFTELHVDVNRSRRRESWQVFAARGLLTVSNGHDVPVSFAWAPDTNPVAKQAGYFAGFTPPSLRAEVLHGRIVLTVLTRDRRTAKCRVEWFRLACTGEWRDPHPQRPEHGVTSTRYSCMLDAGAFAVVLARFVRREPARRQRALAEQRARGMLVRAADEILAEQADPLAVRGEH